MKPSAFAVVPVVLAAIVVSYGGQARGGPLTPPGGAISSTAKPLGEIEPRTMISATTTPGDTDSVCRITQPGSYYLTANLAGTSTKKALEIVTSDVVIDLNGFEITGVGGAQHGVSIDPVATSGNVTIRNGTIRNCRTGIDAQLYGRTILENLNIRNCSLGGAVIKRAMVRNCNFTSNTGTGLIVDGTGTVEFCTSSDNTGNGFSSISGGVVFRGCAASGNDSHGFDVTACTVTDCQATFNSFLGFRNPSVITGSYAAGGTTPLSLSSGLAANCSIEGGSADGVTMSTGSRMQGCRVIGAANHGIRILALGTRCSVVQCTVSTCGSAAGQWAGILVEGTDNAVTDCHVSDMNTGGDDIGIWVTGVSNLIIRNAATACNDFYNIAASNAPGPEIGSAAVATNTVPTANIGY